MMKTKFYQKTLVALYFFLAIKGAVFSENTDLTTQTSAGKIEMERILGEEQLEREQIISLLGQDEELCASLTEHMKVLAAAEQDFLWFWNQDGQSEQLFDDSKALACNKLVDQFIFPALYFVPLALVGFVCLSEKNLDGVKGLSKALVFMDGKDWSEKIKSYLLADVFFIPALIGMYKIIKSIKNQKHYSAVQKKMIAAASYLHAAKQMGDLIANNVVLAPLAPALQQTDASVVTKKLLDALASKTFKGSPSFFSHQGKAVAWFRLMTAIKDNFLGSMKTVGQLDAYLTLAQAATNHKQALSDTCEVQAVL